jgi:hypothetical protein
MSQAATKLAVEEQAPPLFSDFVLSAKLELHACLQLLTERARFVTGASWAAIALREGEQFFYRAATGNSSPEIGAQAEIGVDLSSPQPFIQEDRKSLFGAVLREGEMIGFIQLVSQSFDFPDEDWRFVARVAELIETAIDHMEAAEHSHEMILTQPTVEDSQELTLAPPSVQDLGDLDKTPVKQPSKPIPLFWHAPDGAQPLASTKSSVEDASVAVRLCESCGFPVSPGRKICVDCEERGRVVPAPLLLHPESPTSWIGAHGYTIASLLVPAVAAAIYLWLR